MPSISRYSVAKLVLLCLVLVGGGLLAHSCSFSTRACRDNVVCMVRDIGEKIPDGGTYVTVYGYKCVDLLCRNGCTTDADCDVEKGYKCDTTTTKNGLCRCDVSDLTKPCHKQCFRDDECKSRVDPNTKQPLFPNGKCEANATNANLPGECLCDDTTKPLCRSSKAEPVPETPAEEELLDEPVAEDVEAEPEDGGGD